MLKVSRRPSLFPKLPLAGLAGILVFAGASDALARELDETIGALGTPGNAWAGNWTVYEPNSGRLAVAWQPEAAPSPAHLNIQVSSDGDPEAGSAQNSSGLSRALNPDRPVPGGGKDVLQFQFWLDDEAAFQFRGSSFGFCGSDTRNLAALSSRSTWNLVCFGAKTDLGGQPLQAGELALRVARTAGGELTTIPTGILVEGGRPIRVTVQTNAEAATFSIRLEKDTEVFETSDLGFWAREPDPTQGYFNLFFSTPPGREFSLNVGGLSCNQTSGDSLP